MKTIAIAALIAIGSSSAASDANDIDGVIGKLDLTTFPNSIGPGRSPDRTRFADNGFVVVLKTASRAKLVRKADGATKSFVVISNGPKYMRLCFRDRFFVRLGDAAARSSGTTTALLVRKSWRGTWPAEQIKGGFPSCHNDPPAA